MARSGAWMPHDVVRRGFPVLDMPSHCNEQSYKKVILLNLMGIARLKRGDLGAGCSGGSSRGRKSAAASLRTRARGDTWRNSTNATGAHSASAKGVWPNRSKTSRPIPIISGIKKITIIGLSITAETAKPQAVQVRELVINRVRLHSSAGSLGWSELMKYCQRPT